MRTFAGRNCRCCFVILLVAAVLGLGFSQTASPPEILEIVFPHETIPADGSKHPGKVVFKDADGDAQWADFHVQAADPQALTIDDQTPEDGVVRLKVGAPADRQKQGQGIVLFKIAATQPQKVRIRVVLIDEAGNTSDPNDPKASFSFTVRGPQPDLVVSLGELPERVEVGQTLEATYTVRNLGGGDSGPFRVGVYLSGDTAVTPEDLLVHSKEIGNLAPDASTTEQLRTEITQDLLARGGLGPGPLFLGVIADDLDQVEESDETNNVASSVVKVEPPPKRPAFFKVADLSVEPRTLVAGSTVTIKATIENTGEEVGTKPVELYIDGVRRDSRSPTLNPGQRETVSFSYTFAFTEPPREVTITVKTPDYQQTLSIRITQAPYTVCPSGCPFTKIQQAIDAAESGEIITVGPGTYSENLTITKSLTLDGAGRATISSAGANPAVFILNTRNVTIKGFTITGGRHGIVIQNISKATIVNNVIQNSAGKGLLVLGSSEVEVRGNKIVDHTGPEWVWSGREGPSHCLSGVTTNIFGGGIEIQDSKSITLFNNTISGNTSGIDLANSRGTINDNIIRGNNGEGIGIYGGSDVTISNNAIEGNVSAGIGIHSSKAIISDNTIRDNTQVGILIFVSSEVEVTRNDIINTRPYEGKVGDGIEVMDGSKAIITNNTISGNARFGIMFPARGYGIDKPRDSSGEIRDNTINANKNDGIALWTSVDLIISGNTIQDNGGCGIYADRSTNITSCSRNMFSGNKGGNYCGAARWRCY